MVQSWCKGLFGRCTRSPWGLTGRILNISVECWCKGLFGRCTRSPWGLAGSILNISEVFKYRSIVAARGNWWWVNRSLGFQFLEFRNISLYESVDEVIFCGGST